MKLGLILMIAFVFLLLPSYLAGQSKKEGRMHIPVYIDPLSRI